VGHVPHLHQCAGKRAPPLDALIAVVCVFHVGRPQGFTPAVGDAARGRVRLCAAAVGWQAFPHATATSLNLQHVMRVVRGLLFADGAEFKCNGLSGHGLWAGRELEPSDAKWVPSIPALQQAVPARALELAALGCLCVPGSPPCVCRWEELHWRREVFLALLRLYEQLLVYGYLPARHLLLEDYTDLEVEVGAAVCPAPHAGAHTRPHTRNRRVARLLECALCLGNE
jgi:hypothetical protein